ncbi:biotin--[acetyl-CoA-carboxylase] ligase [Mycobacterium sp. SMC-4]|uniref:biotin--[acetyl-CoA-carboxylase] ligase n=1 Tax=Mycobacterium sp. SMC-4 TaxID=2857059 RepID=UPI003CFE3ACC
MDRSPIDVEALRQSLPPEWHRVDVVPETGSTNADLIARKGRGEDIAGTVLLAEHQTAGRGRHGRTWSAPPRSQIAMSAGVDATGVATETWGWLPLLTGLAVVETVRDLGVEAVLKWPNDVLVGSEKLAGILAEVSGHVIVVGVGVNVSLTPEELPDPRAVSLSMLGIKPERTTLAIALLTALSRRLMRWRDAGGADAATIRDYRRVSATIGARVRAVLPGGSEIVGTALGIDDSGRLLIDDGNATVTVSAGDLTHLRPAV